MDGNFVVVGNIAQLDQFEQVVPDLLRYGPTLMLVTGNVTPDGKDESYRAAYAHLESLNKRYGLAIEVTPGLQDKGGEKLTDTYRGYFGEPSASFIWNGIKFITLDSSSGELGPKQLEFLEKHLNAPSFIFTHVPPKVGLWEMGALKSGTQEFLDILKERSRVVLGCFFGGLTTLSRQELVAGIPGFVVGNGVESLELSKFGYSRPGKKGGLAVLMKNGRPEFEAIEVEAVV